MMLLFRFRCENVCLLWRSVIKNLVRKGTLRKPVHVLRRLGAVSSFNESLSIKDTKKIHSFREGSALAMAAEKIHQTNMDIIRLKYPRSLHRCRIVLNFVKSLNENFGDYRMRRI